MGTQSGITRKMLILELLATSGLIPFLLTAYAFLVELLNTLLHLLDQTIDPLGGGGVVHIQRANLMLVLADLLKLPLEYTLQYAHSH